MRNEKSCRRCTSRPSMVSIVRRSHKLRILSRLSWMSMSNVSNTMDIFSAPTAGPCASRDQTRDHEPSECHMATQTHTQARARAARTHLVTLEAAEEAPRLAFGLVIDRLPSGIELVDGFLQHFQHLKARTDEQTCLTGRPRSSTTTTAVPRTASDFSRKKNDTLLGVEVEQNLNADFRRLLGGLSVMKNFASFLSSRRAAMVHNTQPQRVWRARMSAGPPIPAQL